MEVGTKNIKASTIVPIELFKSSNTIEVIHHKEVSHWWAKAQYKTDTSIYYETTDGMTIYGIK